MPTCTSFAFPLNTLINMSAKIPPAKPEAIEPVKIVNIIITKGPKESTKFEKSISLNPLIIKNLIKIKAGPVAAFGIITNNGAKKAEIINNIPTTTDENPVFHQPQHLHLIQHK